MDFIVNYSFNLMFLDINYENYIFILVALNNDEFL